MNATSSIRDEPIEPETSSRALESSSVRWPNAEIEVSAVLVEELLRRQHPDLAELKGYVLLQSTLRRDSGHCSVVLR